MADPLASRAHAGSTTRRANGLAAWPLAALIACPDQDEEFGPMVPSSAGWGPHTGIVSTKVKSRSPPRVPRCRISWKERRRQPEHQRRWVRASGSVRLRQRVRGLERPRPRRRRTQALRAGSVWTNLAQGAGEEGAGAVGGGAPAAGTGSTDCMYCSISLGMVASLRTTEISMRRLRS
jgi:hypothetical protein